ncbi:methyltransferase [Enterococcus faecalis]|uniref:methyltransferase n=1 Tax=Enterococcus faecalis TaxID=1351 RepID=UPI0021C97E60|nr:methyltransferase [Enterococcus faecalis]
MSKIEDEILNDKIKCLFKTRKSFDEWNLHKNEIALELNNREFGDYQTPESLVSKVYELIENKGISYSTLIEPTCGKGNFIIEGLKREKNNLQKVFAIEKQPQYIWQLVSTLVTERLYDKAEFDLNIHDFFDFDFTKIVDENCLIIGNPPWITNSELSSLKSDNLPIKSNFKKVKGFDALTGKANFDIAEFILISLIDNLNAKGKGTIAFLVKNIVSRNILKLSKEVDWNITTFEIYNFDAKKEFNVFADASLIFLRIGEDKKEKQLRATEYSLYDYSEPIKKFGWIQNEFVSDIDKYLHGCKIEKGNEEDTRFIWRSGLKHDASKVMELTINEEDAVIAKDGTVFSKRQPTIFPLYKSSDISKITNGFVPRKYVIVTQKKIGESTDYIQNLDKKVWDYLNKNKTVLSNRKSSIYKDKPKYSIFGIGDYSFRKYKIAISGMYKVSRFSLIEPIDGKSPMVDDTVYFLSTDNKVEALILYGLLNSKLVQDFLESIAFKDNKRPYTKEILTRISIKKASQLISLNELNEILSEGNLDLVDEIEYYDFVKKYD